MCNYVRRFFAFFALAELDPNRSLEVRLFDNEIAKELHRRWLEWGLFILLFFILCKCAYVLTEIVDKDTRALITTTFIPIATLILGYLTGKTSSPPSHPPPRENQGAGSTGQSGQIS